MLTIVRGARRICREPPPFGMIFDGLAVCFYKSLILLNNKIFLKKFEKRLDERARKAHIAFMPSGNGRKASEKAPLDSFLLNME